VRRKTFLTKSMVVCTSFSVNLFPTSAWDRRERQAGTGIHAPNPPAA
jgi:hypothetical protein